MIFFSVLRDNKIPMEQMKRFFQWVDAGRKKVGGNLVAVSTTQFTTAFSLTFVNTFLPFYIFSVSPYSPRETLLWVGAIIGSSGVSTAIASPLWGSLTHRFSPKKLYMRGMFTHSVMFLLMAFTTNLHMLLALRIIQGFFGGVSTTGIILVSSEVEKEQIASNLGVFQSSITLGQLLGPPLGAFAAALLGYRNGFLAGALFLFGSFILARRLVHDVPPLSKPEKSSKKPVFDRRIPAAWVICLAVQIQLIFLPSVLPTIFKGFRMDETSALKMAGVVVMLYSATSVLGQFIWTRLSKRFGVVRMVGFLLVMSIAFQAGLALTRGLADFTLVRMLQTGFASAAIPLVISLFLQNPRGGTVGLLNAARFTGMAVGPLLATSVVAYSGLNSLYLLISGVTVVAFLCFKYFFTGQDS